jgi:hypothetical protein
MGDALVFHGLFLGGFSTQRVRPGVGGGHTQEAPGLRSTQVLTAAKN